MSHSVITNMGIWGDPAHESLVVKALARVGRATSALLDVEIYFSFFRDNVGPSNEKQL